METLPSEFDIIIVGTGLIESVLAAAASRIGKRVLHIDNKNYYGGVWASFNLESIQTSLQSSEPSNIENDRFKIKDLNQEWFIPEKLDDESQETWTQNSLLKQARKFNLDLCPKLQFARGDFVELLISSNIARYSEFRSISRVFTYSSDTFKMVPCSRSDVFSTDAVSAIEKRLLMKLLNTCIDSEQEAFNDYSDKTFETFLKDKQLSQDLINYIQYAIAMCTKETPCIHGVNKTKRFVNSVGRFGKTPFLYSMYGSGELPQAFCRMSAVFGGVYALNQPLKDYNMDHGHFKSLTCGDQEITAQHLVTALDYAPKELLGKIGADNLTYIARAIFISDKSFIDAESEHLSLLLLPSEDGKELCFVLESGPATGTCPKGLYVTYMFKLQTKATPKEDLEYFYNKMFNKESGPKILWSCYYSVPNTGNINFKLSENVYTCPGPDFDLDYDESIKKAREIFESVYPGEEFLPRAPDPEEIIIGDDDGGDGEDLAGGDGANAAGEGPKPDSN